MGNPSKWLMNNLAACRAYLGKLPFAVSGAEGSDATLRAAGECVRFGLYEADAMALLREWNGTHCQPPWTEKELAHKLSSARNKAGGQRRPARQAKPAEVTVWRIVRKTPAPLAPSSTPAPPAPPTLATTAKPFPILDLPDDFFSTYPAARPALDNQRLTPPPAAH